MDIRCPVCCEPWEIDTLHEYVGEMCDMFPNDGYSFRETYRRFMSEGCGAAFAGWKVSCELDGSGSGPGMIYATVGEMFGDDVDGFASFCEDFDRFGSLS